MRVHAAWVCVLLAMSARPASAQLTGLDLHARLVFYGDDAEFSNPFRSGQTIVGTWGAAFLEASIGDRVAVRAGGFGNWRFGSPDAIDQGRPVLALVVRTGHSRIILGTLDTMRHLDGRGPDRTGPHGLLPPMQRETLAFDRAYEAGLQWTVDSPRYTQDAWINWQRENVNGHREVFDAGATAVARVRPDFALRGDIHTVHRGGQQGGVEPVSDSLAAAAGVEAGGPVDRLDRLSLEIYAVGSRLVADRADHAPADLGFGAFLRAALVAGPWRAHLIMWRGHDFVKVEGDPVYQSVVSDGRPYRGFRDYAELGGTRRFALARDTFVEASVRLHRIEDDYEFSFRVVGVARLAIPLLK
jgi:hypothetical protein